MEANVQGSSIKLHWGSAFKNLLPEKNRLWRTSVIQNYNERVINFQRREREVLMCSEEFKRSGGLDKYLQWMQ